MKESTPQDLSNLEQLLQRIGQTAQDMDRVSLGIIIKAVGRRSFGPLLLFVGVFLASPLSGVPGFPTIMGLFVLLIAVQLLLRRDHFWLPQWLLKRSVPQEKLDKAIKWLFPPARFVDRMIRPRLTIFIYGPSIYVIAAICVLIALCLPAMEIIPFSATGAGVVLAAFGLSLIAHDGVLVLLAFACSIFVFGFVFSKLFF